MSRDRSLALLEPWKLHPLINRQVFLILHKMSNKMAKIDQIRNFGNILLAKIGMQLTMFIIFKKNLHFDPMYIVVICSDF